MNKERQRQYSANALNAPSGLAQPDMDDPARKENRFPGFSMDAFAAEEAKANHQNGGNNAAARFGSSYTGGFERSTSADHSAARPQSGYFDAFARGGPPGPPGPGAGQQPAGPVGYGPAMAAGGNNNSFPPFGSLSPESAKGGSLIKNRKGELDANTPLEELQGEIFALCKDQHGCRYLQKKLEEGVPSYRDMIFAETFSHFAELMTDPFGNYLCQKMLEYCTDEQRNLIVESVAPELVTISLNMHGTRAVQKTIDFLSTPRQISSIIVALSMSVVTLIKDLNGNHVIQKCLNRLSSDDNQFIYNAVAAHCVEVATHRHGCCVLQRCVDHASDSQRIQLVSEITYNALTLVQDPFGNYVVQYILDLNDPRFSDAVIRQFVGNVCLLSVQKFSSNVIEKCIRVSDVKLRKSLIDELLNRTRLEKLLRDSFANYVVQTSLDYAEPMQRMQLVECIRPILPMIRNTPYGKRIQSKLQRDNIELAPPGNVHFSLLQAAHHQQLQAMAAIANRQTTASDYVGNINPYNTAAHGAMHRQPGTPHGPHRPPHHHGGPPPPQQASMYGGQQPPAQFAGGRLPPPHHHHHPAAGFGAGGPPPAPPPGVGMGGSGPSTPNLGGPHGHHHGQHHHQQAPNYPPAYAYGAGGGMPSPMALHGQFPGYGAPF
ncbi:hypothetical protein L7F22_015911 [Adiantum nelumboides]|nr:hypothetical protein [Adiantum nelumboides]